MEGWTIDTRSLKRTLGILVGAERCGLRCLCYNHLFSWIMTAANPKDRLGKLHECWTAVALSHPWHDGIKDVACGYDDRLIDPHCCGCHRSREESPSTQIARYA